MNDYINSLILNNFNNEIVNISKINGGWLTDKWKADFKNYSIMIKRVELEKIKRRGIDIEIAGKLLKSTNDNDIRSPRIYRINNNLVNYDEQNRPIIFIEYIKDTFLKDYTNINKDEIYDIGREIYKIRECFDKIDINYKIDYNDFLNKIKSDYNKRVESGIISNNMKYLEDVYKEKKIIDSLDIDFFKGYKIGFCHRDLSSDNILFDEKGFRAIIDFELANISFVLYDIARIFLTFCLDNEGNVNKELLSELISGYGNISLDELCKGIRLLWCIEVSLWIKEAYYVDKNPEKVDKFIYEINWITENWDNLENILKLQ